MDGTRGTPLCPWFAWSISIRFRTNVPHELQRNSLRPTTGFNHSASSGPWVHVE